MGEFLPGSYAADQPANALLIRHPLVPCLVQNLSGIPISKVFLQKARSEELKKSFAVMVAQWKNTHAVTGKDPV